MKMFDLEFIYILVAATMIGFVFAVYAYSRRRGSLVRRTAPVDLLTTVMLGLTTLLFAFRDQVTTWELVAWSVTQLAILALVLRLLFAFNRSGSKRDG